MRSELWEPIKNTVPMVALGYVFSIVIGILVGVISAWRRGTFTDKAGLWTGLTLLLDAAAMARPHARLLRRDCGRLTDVRHRRPDPRHPRATRRPSTSCVDRLEHMILPSLTIGLVLFGEYALIVRSAMLETLGEDYALTARAKGLSNWATVWRHGFRNALLPVVTLVALTLGFVIGGFITVEYVFSYPGIGLAVVEAIDQRDFPVLQGAFLLLALSVIVLNLLADLVYFKLDPRISA